MADLKNSQSQTLIPFPTKRFRCHECEKKNVDSVKSLCSRSRRLRRNMYLIEIKSRSLKRRDKRLKEIHEKLRLDLRCLHSSNPALSEASRDTDIHTNDKYFVDNGGNCKTIIDGLTNNEVIFNMASETESKIERKANIELCTKIKAKKDIEISTDVVNEVAPCVFKYSEPGMNNEVDTDVVKTDEVYSKIAKSAAQNMILMGDHCVNLAIDTHSRTMPFFLNNPRSKHCNRYQKRTNLRSTTLSGTSDGKLKHILTETPFHRFSPCRTTIHRQRRTQLCPTTSHENISSPKQNDSSNKLNKVLKYARSVLRVLSVESWPRNVNGDSSDFLPENTSLKRCTN